MLHAKRLEEITKILEKDKSVDVKSLSEKLGVTPKTIRQDLDKLVEMDLIERVHGGAILKRGNNGIFPIAARKQRNIEEKNKIAERAYGLIEEGDIIFLDAGSTVLPIARLLGDHKVTVITNDPVIIQELLHKQNIDLYVIGGKLRREEGAFTVVGHTAEEDIRKYNVHKYFLAASAIDFQQGLMTFYSDEAEIKKTVMDISKQIICVSDYSKFHKVALFTICPLEAIDVLITDERITYGDREQITEKGIKLEVVE